MGRRSTQLTDPVEVEQYNAGIKTIFTCTLGDELIRLAGIGMNLGTMAATVGISDDMLQRLRDREPDFAAALARARFKAKSRYVGVIDRAAMAGDWRAADRMCKIMYPDEFVEQLQVGGIGGGEVAVRDVTLEALAKGARNDPAALENYHGFLKALGSGGAGTDQPGGRGRSDDAGHADSVDSGAASAAARPAPRRRRRKANKKASGHAPRSARQK